MKTVCLPEGVRLMTLQESRGHFAELTKSALFKFVGVDVQEKVNLVKAMITAMLAQRPGEIRHAQWEEFDFDEAIWAIPAAKMKMRRDHLVPLPEQALALLSELNEITGEFSADDLLGVIFSSFCIGK